MAKREKLHLPEGWIETLDAERKRRKLSWRDVAKMARVKPPTLTRLRKQEASWDSVLRVAGVLEVQPPFLVDPASPAGRLEWLRRHKPREYQVVARMVKAASGEFPAVH